MALKGFALPAIAVLVLVGCAHLPLREAPEKAKRSWVVEVPDLAPGVLEGTAVDRSTGQPVVNAVATLSDRAGIRRSLAAGDGSFRFENVSGDARLGIGRIGYSRDRLRFRVRSAGGYRVRFLLREDPIDGSPVTVTTVPR